MIRWVVGREIVLKEENFKMDKEKVRKLFDDILDAEIISLARENVTEVVGEENGWAIIKSTGEKKVAIEYK